MNGDSRSQRLDPMIALLVLAICLALQAATLTPGPRIRFARHGLTPWLPRSCGWTRRTGYRPTISSNPAAGRATDERTAAQGTPAALCSGGTKSTTRKEPSS
jgi:hypothetical protein